MIDIKGLNEECGIIGISNKDQAPLLTYYGIHSLQHRGQEACGIALQDNDNIITCIKGLGLVNDVLNNEEVINNKAKSCIAHVRYATAGNNDIDNVQPFCFSFNDESIALAHNGHIANISILKKELEDSGSIFSSTSDSEILMHLLRSKPSLNFRERLINSLLQLDGAFAFVLLHDSGLYGIRDRNGLRPLSLAQFKDGSYTLASETCAFNMIGATFVRDILPGEIVCIKDNKITSYYYTTDTKTKLCLMEYVYFARPDSNLDGYNVHQVRAKIGRNLARVFPIKADIVVGVPDSSLSIAQGYAREIDLPNEMGLIKNRYIARTFIAPTQELRDQGVKMKLSALKEVVDNKDIILIDDSIVRATTSKRIVNLLKEAGANKIHVLIGAPPIKYPCCYGVDMSTYDELISSRLNKEELREYINADSLDFINLNDLINSISKEERYCTACFNKEYPTKVYDDLFKINKGEY